ncbi:MAG: gamma-butyrobetaine dioxygenase [Gammaproteobacteria bacterium]|jgi:gamma-butyrobetaine dioxygenase
MTANDPRYFINNALTLNGELVVHWADGHKSRYHPMLLRHQCECSLCGTSLNGVRTIRIHHIPENINPSEVSHTNSEVKLVWSTDGHESSYLARWLRCHCYSDSERHSRKHVPTLWDASISDSIPTANFEEARANPKARLALLEAVCDFGFCKIINAPTDANQSKQLIELIGSQRQSHYGTYNLAKKKAIDNVGDTTNALDPHIDETYRLSHVGITVFQVLNPSSNGGDSTLVDGFEAARRLREYSPEDFKLLTELAITNHRFDRAQSGDRDPRWYISRLPLIRLDSDSEVCGIHFNERQIAPLDLPADKIGPCYRALRKIFETLYDPALRLTFKLKAGDGLIFNNQRILHGRTSFEPEEPSRSVLTSSVDIEEFHSTLRILKSSLGYKGPQIAYSQGMAG